MKKFIVRFTFVADFEDENDSSALSSAACALRYGVEARHLKLEVVSCQPLPTANQTPAPVEDKQEVSQAAPSDEIHF